MSGRLQFFLLTKTKVVASGFMVKELVSSLYTDLLYAISLICNNCFYQEFATYTIIHSHAIAVILSISLNVTLNLTFIRKFI